MALSSCSMGTARTVTANLAVATPKAPAVLQLLPRPQAPLLPCHPADQLNQRLGIPLPPGSPQWTLVQGAALFLGIQVTQSAAVLTRNWLLGRAGTVHGLIFNGDMAYAQCVASAGCWVLGAGCWVLGAGCWVLGAGCWLTL